MGKALEVNDNTAQKRERQPNQPAAEPRPDEKLEGKSFQVNENSVEEGEPIHSSEVNDNTAQKRERQPNQPAAEPRSDEKLEGKSFQVNENSVEEGEPIHSSAPKTQKPQ